MTALLALLVFAVVATGCGWLLRVVVGADERDLATTPRLDCVWTTLLGALAIAAVQPNLAALGAPRDAVLATTCSASIAGWWFAWRRRLLTVPPRDVVVAAVVFALLLLGPIVLALTRPLLGHDPLLIWLPKVEEVATGAPTQLHHVTLQHLNPFYPRGMAWLTTTAAMGQMPNDATVRALPLLFTWLTAIAMHGALRQRIGALGAGSLAALFVLLPEVRQIAHAGMADTPLAAAVLAAGLGLSQRRQRTEWALLAIVAGLGGAAIKEEGTVVLAVVVAMLLFDLATAGERRRTVALLASVVVVVPFAVLRAAVPQTRLDTLGPLLAVPDMLLRRVAAVIECIGRMLVDPSLLTREGERPFVVPVPWVGWVAVAALLLLVPRRWPRPITAAPAIVLLLAAGATQVASSVDIRWHARTTLVRLAIEVVPLLLVAATARLAAARAEPPSA